MTIVIFALNEVAVVSRISAGRSNITLPVAPTSILLLNYQKLIFANYAFTNQETTNLNETYDLRKHPG
jgi:hypothetical protein